MINLIAVISIVFQLNGQLHTMELLTPSAETCLADSYTVEVVLKRLGAENIGITCRNAGIR